MTLAKTWLAEKDKYGHMIVLKEMRGNNSEDFNNYLRMNGEVFDVCYNQSLALQLFQ